MDQFTLNRWRTNSSYMYQLTMHLLVTQTCDTEIVHHALMSNTPTCDIVFMMYKGHDGGRRVYQCPVSSTPVSMRTLLPFLILTGIWSSSQISPELSLYCYNILYPQQGVFWAPGFPGAADRPDRTWGRGPRGRRWGPDPPGHQGAGPG